MLRLASQVERRAANVSRIEMVLQGGATVTRLVRNIARRLRTWRVPSI